MSCREVPLVEVGTAKVWHEQMQPGEFAVHVSQSAGSVPSCSVCEDLAAAETRAAEIVARRPEVRCRIYDHQGFVGAPLREVSGSQFKGERDLSPRVRRWTGLLMLLIGGALCLLDWSVDFRLTWPGLVGSRLLIPGAVLLVTEALILLNARQKTLAARRQDTPQ